MILRLLFFIYVFFVCSSCAHFISDKSVYKSISHKEISTSALYNVKHSQAQSSFGEIELTTNSSIQKWVKYFTGRGKSVMKLYLERSSRYIPLMQAVLQENNLPVNLVYIALIESGFSPKAFSRSSAVGYWQFIYGTGKRYGLRINGFIDERRDPVLSTRAAANYFKDLYSLFGSWPLALASYNSGEYRVNRAVLKHYNRDFWYLSSKKALPRETRNYIPKLISAILIAKNPKKYGFFDINYQKAISYDVIKIHTAISLKKLAKNMNLKKETLKSLNPAYKGDYIPIYDGKTVLRIPLGTKSLAQASLKASKMNRPNRGYYYHYWYHVRNGDSLYKIARRHKTTIYKLKKLNRLSTRSILRIGQKMKIPTRRLIASKNRFNKKRTLASSSHKGIHVVKKGQSLASIAKLYGISLRKLKSINNIRTNVMIHPRQKLRIKTRAKPSKLVKNKQYYIVQKGDNLINIASKYKISVLKLMKWNSIKFKSVILTGTRLIISK